MWLASQRERFHLIAMAFVLLFTMVATIQSEAESVTKRERGILVPSEERFMLGAIKLGQLRVREIMVPRPDMHVLPIDAKLEDALKSSAQTNNR